MLGQLDIWGKTKLERTIERIKYFEPAEGYYLAFSGGKDSIVCKELLNIAGVKYDTHYSHTTVDPPELIQYMRKYHKDVIIEYPKLTMWKLIVKKRMPPTRLVRYCCSELKENGGNNRFVITGVRWAESTRRKNTRNIIEFDSYGSRSREAVEKREIFLMSDNEEKRRMIENCSIKGKHILNPIIDWTDKEIWDFIKQRKLPYCKLYNEGFNRLGCIGCPMAGKKGMEKDFKRWPTYKRAYIRAFDKMVQKRKEDGLKTDVWKNGQDVFNWWIGE